jgi:hypothetical protein
MTTHGAEADGLGVCAETLRAAPGVGDALVDPCGEEHPTATKQMASEPHKRMNR